MGRRLLSRFSASKVFLRFFLFAQGLGGIVSRMTANQIISAKILTLVADGKDIIEAMEIVLPDCDIDAMIGELYDDLRANAKMEVAS